MRSCDVLLGMCLTVSTLPACADAKSKDKKSNDDDSKQKTKKSKEKSSDPVTSFLDTANDHLRKRPWEAKDRPPNALGKMTTKLAFLSGDAAFEYPEGFLRPIGDGKAENQFSSIVVWNPERRDVALLTLCFSDPSRPFAASSAGNSVESIIDPLHEKWTREKGNALVARSLAGVLSGRMTKVIVSESENSFIPTEEFPVPPLEGALFIGGKTDLCVRIVSPEARKDKAFLSSVIEGGNWPALEKKL